MSLGHYITVTGVIRVRLIVQVWVLTCFNWSGLISIALTMVPCVSSATKSRDARPTTLPSPAEIAVFLIEASTRKSTHWVKASRVLASFLNAVVFWQKMHIFGYVLLLLGSSRAGLCSSLSILNSGICEAAAVVWEMLSKSRFVIKRLWRILW